MGILGYNYILTIKIFDLFIGDELSLDELDRLNSEFVMDYWPQIEWFLEDGGYWSKEYPECILDE